MRMRRGLFLALASVLAFVVLEVGCAGGGSGGITQTKPSGGGGGGQAGKGPDPFTAINPLVQPRQYAASARILSGSLQGQILITGGLSNVSGQIQASAFAELFNPANLSFTPVVNMNTPRMNHAAVALSDGSVLIVGGVDNNGNVLNTAEIFDPVRGVFRPLSSTLPVGVQLPVVVPFCSSQSGPFNTNSSVFDPAQPGGCPTGQYIHVLIAGGFTDSGATTPTNRAVIFDPLAGTFNAINNLPFAVGAAAGVAVPSGTGTSAGTAPDIVIFGGLLSNGTTTNRVQLYNLSTRTTSLYNGSWSSSALLNTSRAFLTATRLVEGAGNTGGISACNNYVVLAGGETVASSGTTAANTAEVYAPSSTAGQIGTLLTGTPFALANTSGRFAHRAELIEATSPGEAGQILLTGGLNFSTGGPTVLNDAELLAPTVNSGNTACTGLTATATGGPMVDPHAFHIISRLLDGSGRIVLAGGSDGSGVPSRRAELFIP